MKSNTKTKKRERRHARVRAKIFGTALRPRLALYKSNRYVHAQLIDDEARKTLVAAVSKTKSGMTKAAQAHEAGKILATLAKGRTIERVVFDRGGFLYTGRVRAFAEGAREGGLVF